MPPKKTKKKQPERDVSLALPAVSILVLYVGFITLTGPPGGDGLDRLREEHAAAEQGQVSPKTVDDLRKQKVEQTALLEKTREKRNQLRFQAEQLAGGVGQPLDQIKMAHEVCDIFSRNGLTVTQDNVANSASDKLAKSYTDAKKNLLDSVKLATQKARKPGVRYAPLEPPPGIDIESLPPELRPTTNRNVSASSLHLRELQIWGTYQNMTRALQELGDECGQSVALGLSLERPDQAKQSGLLLWRLVVHVEPALDLPELKKPVSNDKLVHNDAR